MMSDALDECGLRMQVLARLLPPVLTGSRAFGRAATARFVPSEDDEPDNPYRAAIEFICHELAYMPLMSSATWTRW